jgi:hypothetical protein
MPFIIYIHQFSFLLVKFGIGKQTKSVGRETRSFVGLHQLDHYIGLFLAFIPKINIHDGQGITGIHRVVPILNGKS